MKFVRTIVHEIPRGSHKADQEISVRLSGALADMTSVTRDFISSKIVKSGEPSSRDVIEDPNLQANLTKLYLQKCLQGSDEEFIEASGMLADKLFRAQSGNAPAGALVISVIEESVERELLILKSEHQEGMKVKVTSNDDGTETLNFEHLTELIVGGNARIFKSARLRLENADDEPRENQAMVGLMVDLQSGGTGYAEYFLSTFLECVLANPNTKLTQAFLNAGQKLIQNIEDVEEKVEVATHLDSYARTNTEFDVSTREFSDKYLTDQQAEVFAELVPDELRNRSFKMDHSSQRTRREGWKFSSPGVYLVVDPSVVESGEVLIKSNEDGSSEIRISKRLKDFTLVQAPKGAKTIASKPADE